MCLTGSRALRPMTPLAYQTTRLLSCLNKTWPAPYLKAFWIDLEMFKSAVIWTSMLLPKTLGNPLLKVTEKWIPKIYTSLVTMGCTLATYRLKKSLVRNRRHWQLRSMEFPEMGQIQLSGIVISRCSMSLLAFRIIEPATSALFSTLMRLQKPLALIHLLTPKESAV